MRINSCIKLRTSDEVKAIIVALIEDPNTLEKNLPYLNAIIDRYKDADLSAFQTYSIMQYIQTPCYTGIDVKYAPSEEPDWLKGTIYSIDYKGPK
jgi:hypothetical protein